MKGVSILLYKTRMMKRYEIEGYTIFNALPFSFQISSNKVSYKLREGNPDPDGDAPLPIRIEHESLNDTHLLMFTPKLYMRFTWIDDPDEGGNGQMEMGHTDFSKDYNQFINWIVLMNEIPESVVRFIIKLVQDPSSGSAYEVPLYRKDPNEPPSNNNLQPLPPPSPKKKRVYKIAKKKVINKTQRRRRNV
jgi:hypothetical protein